jgi:hypothetical protein
MLPSLLTFFFSSSFLSTFLCLPPSTSSFLILQVLYTMVMKTRLIVQFVFSGDAQSFGSSFSRDKSIDMNFLSKIHAPQFFLFFLFMFITFLLSHLSFCTQERFFMFFLFIHFCIFIEWIIVNSDCWRISWLSKDFLFIDITSNLFFKWWVNIV